MITDCPFTAPPPPERGRDPLDIEAHEAWFRAYAALERACCPFDPGPEDLKLEHTFHVLDNARAISRAAGCAAPLARACLLAALYHDIGRFEQYRLHRTFRDRDSVNHGELGAALVERFDLMRHEPFVRAAVTRAVALHNAWRLPDDLPVDAALATGVVRDADKLDILRVMDEHLSGPKPYEPTVVLSLPDAPDLHSEKVIAMALEGRAASYSDLVSVNDFRLLLGSWVNALHNPESKRLMAAQGHARALLAALPDRHYGRARDALLAALDGLAAR